MKQEREMENEKKRKMMTEKAEDKKSAQEAKDHQSGWRQFSYPQYRDPSAHKTDS